MASIEICMIKFHTYHMKIIEMSWYLARSDCYRLIHAMHKIETQRYSTHWLKQRKLKKTFHNPPRSTMACKNNPPNCQGPAYSV